MKRLMKSGILFMCVLMFSTQVMLTQSEELEIALW